MIRATSVTLSCCACRYAASSFLMVCGVALPAVTYSGYRGGSHEDKTTARLGGFGLGMSCFFMHLITTNGCYLAAHDPSRSFYRHVVTVKMSQAPLEFCRGRRHSAPGD